MKQNKEVRLWPHLEGMGGKQERSPLGIPTMRLGSLTAMLGVHLQSTMAILVSRTWSLMMVNLVSSEAVPAVVLIATCLYWIR